MGFPPLQTAHGEGQGDEGALAQNALNLHGPAVNGYNFLTQGQPKARAACLPGAALVHHVEGLGNLFNLLPGDASPAVPDQDGHPLALGLGGQRQLPALLAGLSAVVQKVIEEGFKELPIHVNGHLRAVHPERQAALGHDGL